MAAAQARECDARAAQLQLQAQLQGQGGVFVPPPLLSQPSEQASSLVPYGMTVLSACLCST